LISIYALDQVRVVGGVRMINDYVLSGWLVMPSDWTYPILAVVFITWGIGFVGLAAWSIHKEYKAHQDQAQEATVQSTPDKKDEGTTEENDILSETTSDRKLPGS